MPPILFAVWTCQTRQGACVEPHTIRCVCGEDRVILDVQLISQHLNSAFPGGTKEFAVLSESFECEHDPRCQWLDNVYWYRDRSVVVQFSQISTTLLENVIRQLKVTHDQRLLRLTTQRDRDGGEYRELEMGGSALPLYLWRL